MKTTKTITTLIVAGDVKDVASRLKMDISDEIIDRVLQEYEDYRTQYPTELWSEIVEIMLCDYKRFDEEAAEESEETRRDFGNDDYMEEDLPPINHFHTDGDGDDDTLLNFMG